MKNNCFSCGVEKDTEVLEVYPFADDGIVDDEPITPLFILDCQGPVIVDDPDNYSEFRMTVVCHSCFHKLSPDMWISKNCWDSLNPQTPYEKLPLFVPGIEDPAQLKPLL